ncbi:MAG: TetR/AcrR family transcriptional regulator [Cyanobacteria bacterium REEB65]|nr:TetR/AcrR family transcriptional regulator [Cyanobacteria bacterium REEB65]
MPRLQSQTLDSVRTQILDAALEAFVRQGYAAATTREIAQRCGMTAGALYNHYASKEALFGAVVERYMARMRDAAENPILVALRKTRFPDDIADLAQAIGDTIARHRPYWLLWYVDVLEFEGRHFQSALAPGALLGEPALQDRLAAVERQGLLRIQPDLAFLMVYMHLMNYFLIEKVFGGRQHYGVPQDLAIGTLTDAFLKGILAAPAVESRAVAHG